MMQQIRSIYTLMILGFVFSCSNKSSFEGKAAETSGVDCAGASLTTCVPPNGDSDAKKKDDDKGSQKNDGGEDSGNDDGEDTGGDSDEIKSKEFDLVAVTQKVDMVWVVDNSGSMGNEIEKVRANFSNFIQRLSSLSDLRFSLVSTKEDVFDRFFSVNLPSPLPAELEARQVDYIVRSNDPLFLAATASCPASSTNFPAPPADKSPESINNADRRLCNQAQAISHGGSLEEGFLLPGSAIPQLVGSLSDFFRPDAKRIYVFVSDDDASQVTSANFLSYVTPFNNNVNPLIYGFVGLNSDNAACDIAKIGDSYISLAETSGGKTFDICEEEWSQHFEELTNHVRLIMKTEFRLDATPREVVEVKLDGVKLNASDYRVEGKVVHIKPEVLAESSEKVVVYYLQ